MKKFLLFFLIAPLILVSGIFWFYLNIKSVSDDKSFKDFLIVKGSGASQIGNKLFEDKLIKNRLAFRIYVQLTGKSAKIQAGEYRLSPSFSLTQTVSQLLRGPAEIWVTIPEGLRHDEIARKFASSLNKDEAFVKEFIALSKSEEGYLFPDTYLFPKDASASSIVSKMTKTFEIKTSGLDLTRDQVILASIIERETKTDAERPIVAGILMNRLNIGMALQVDATLQYAKGNWDPILVSDKSINSSYNTYKFSGLPPAPISNPGLSSLEAAANPIKTDYFYYLHDSKGKIYYAKTFTEHNENIRRYLTD